MERETKIMSYTTHPVLLIAAIAVVLFCGVGIAAVMGWLPQSGAKMGPPVAAAPVQVDPRDIFFELGRRQAVAGQDDLIVDVAMELRKRKFSNPSLASSKNA